MYTTIRYLIASIWLVNGLFCKVLNMIPRHQEIIANILGKNHSQLFTILIGSAEIAMAIWILSGLKSRLNAITQIIIIGFMNLLEFILVPDLLLWGKMNAFFALLLMLSIYFNEFYIRSKNATKN